MSLGWWRRAATALAPRRSVIIGQDDGATAQIASGISANDQIIQDPPDSLIDGERVTVVNSGKASNAGGK